MSTIFLFGYAAVVCSRDPSIPGCAKYIADSKAREATMEYYHIDAIFVGIAIALVCIWVLDRFRAS
jgi:hypothetical protein